MCSEPAGGLTSYTEAPNWHSGVQAGLFTLHCEDATGEIKYKTHT